MEEQKCNGHDICAAFCTGCPLAEWGCAYYENLVQKGEVPPVEQKI